MNTTALFSKIKEVGDELYQLLEPLSESQINTVPFKDSWTPAQLATHVTKSNKGMEQALEMQGAASDRDIAERVPELESLFLNFEIKMQSPPFIVPGPAPYEKQKVLAAFKTSCDAVFAQMQHTQLAEVIDMSKTFGQISKLELCHFVLYHTQRHLHQLKKMLPYLQVAVLQ